MGFGKSKSSSQQQSQATSASYNQAYPFLQGALGDQVGWVGKSSNAIADLLGLNGSPAQTAGFDNFRNSGGYQFIQNEGIHGINANNASKGLLGSGSALKAIADYSSNLASTYLDKYLSHLTGMQNTGLSAASVLSGAGNTAASQSTSSGTSNSKSTNFSLG